MMKIIIMGANERRLFFAAQLASTIASSAEPEIIVEEEKVTLINNYPVANTFTLQIDKFLNTKKRKKNNRKKTKGRK